LPIPFLFLEVLVGFIQALVFSMLTLVYFTIASEDHDAHDEHGHGEEHGEAHGH
jgi:F-type H+-transporting ATPase subunit a